MSDPCTGCTRAQCHDADMDADDTHRVSEYVDAHPWTRFCNVADGIHAINTLRGIDADIFNENLNRTPTEEENKRVREWAGVDVTDC